MTCRCRKKLKTDNNGEEVSVSINKGTMLIENKDIETYVEIKYCPNCGKKIKYKKRKGEN